MTDEKLTELVEEVADEVGGSIYSNYSGRGMFNNTCLGVVCDDATAAIEAAARLGLKGAKTDNMGREYIVYWPNS